MSNLVRASRELFSRTPDETFDSFDQLYQYCSTLQERSIDRWEPPQSVTPAILDSGQLGLSIGSSGQFALNDWSFGQLCGLSRVDKQTINRLQTRNGHAGISRYSAARSQATAGPDNG
jgi:hypothetical protein